MKIETKKELLKYKIVNDKFSFNILMYRIINDSSCLNDIILDIDDISLTNNINIPTDGINANQFLVLLNRFLYYIEEYLGNLKALEYITNRIIENNADAMREYLSLKLDIFDSHNTELITEKIFKIIFSNFIDNGKYIESIKKLLEERNIKYKDTKDYSFDESVKIANLLSDLVFCQRGRGNSHLLFERIEKEIKIRLEGAKKNKNSKHDDNYYKESIINHYQLQYEKIIESYHKKKKYLKYFE